MMRKMLLLCLTAALLTSCAAGANESESIQPRQTQQKAQLEKLETNEQGVPVLKVYVVSDEKVERMDAETYVQGVLAGEMKNDWPLEALKAQAILARTFVLKFVQEKESRYEGADISTDIEEAQAYDATGINDRIRRAVAETEGMVLYSHDQLPYAWFHAHSGGMTELARAGLGWEKEEPPYTTVAQGNEPETAQDAQALTDAQAWQARFSFEEFQAACARQGVETPISAATRITVDQRGDSGRAVSIRVGEHPVQAAELRLALGSTKMRSTLLTSLKTDADGILMAGKGYGHGVGMSQWGAYGMAQEGKSAEEIVMHYFQEVTLARAW